MPDIFKNKKPAEAGLSDTAGFLLLLLEIHKRPTPNQDYLNTFLFRP